MKQKTKTSEEDESEEKRTNKHIRWARVHYIFAQDNKKEKFKENLKKVVPFDSDLNASIFCEKDYVIDIRNVKETMGVGTNGNGQLISNQKCIVPHLGEQWFNRELMYNE